MKRCRITFAVAIGFLAMTFGAGEAQAAIPTAERTALIDFYTSTTGAGWSNSTNWLGAVGTECTWYGVTCDETEDHVIGIKLKSNNLNGSIPTSIGDFPELVVLVLLINHLTGPIPASIGKLAALQTLNAYDGSLSGPLPPEIGNLSNLTDLQLSGNQIGGAIPAKIGNLTSLTNLDMEANLLSGPIPPEIGDLSNLRFLRLGGNQLSNAIPSEIGDLSNLRGLHLGSNQLSGPIPSEIGYLTSLSQLDLSYNNLVGPLPVEIADLVGLYGLFLSSNAFTGTIPSAIGRFPNLRYLDLDRNSFSGEIPSEIGDIGGLTRLRLDGNQLEGPIPDEIVKLVDLYDGSGLDIGYNALYTDSHAVDAFLDLKHSGSGDWRDTQTVAPTEVSVGSVTNTTVELTWTPIDYTADAGGYSAWFATASGGPYTMFARTSDKSATSITVLGLSPVVNYYFYVDAVTDPHSSNQNSVVSEPSLEVATRTFSGGAPALSIGDATVVEGDSGTVNAVFTVSLHLTSPGPVMVSVVTGGGTATAGNDYVASTIPLTFSPGETSKTASVPVNGDTLVEGDETFFASLTAVSGAGVGRNVGTATIADDDTGLVTHERQALIDLYNNTNGAGWTQRFNWRNPGDTDFNDPGTECTWHGVTCDATGQRVTVIKLENNNLDGTFPNSIGDFTVLEFLFLGRNGLLGGPIPPSIGKLAALEGLWAYDGSLSGPIPAEIGDLSNLEHVWFEGNLLSGPIPAEIGDLSFLQTLSIEDNSLSGSIPPEIGNLGSLIRLELGHNGLSETIPAELGLLSQLEFLHLGSNSLSGPIPPEIGDLENLRLLLLSSNQLTGSIPQEIGDLLNLSQLDLSQNQLSEPIPPVIGDLSQLTVLDLGQNRLSGPIPAEIGNLTALVVLYLDDNLLTGSIFSDINNLTDLRGLDLRQNRLSGPIPPGLGDLTALRNLYLSANDFIGPIPSDLADLTALRDMQGLDLRWNGLHTDSVFLAAFLNLKHSNLGDWRDTQTVAPENPTVISVDDHTAWLSWDEVDYIEDDGGYEVFFAPTASGSWASGGWTSDKSQTTFPVTGLDPATIYDLAVVSFTDPHPDNQNLVTSDLGEIEMATTSDFGCPEPEIVVDYSAGITLSVPGTFSTFSWSTGETTATIVVDPPEALWYWVEVTGVGGCEDTAAAWVAPPLFVDGFETGDTSGWSSTTP